MNVASSQALDLTFAALADPTRRAILARLAIGDTNVMELAKPFKMSQPAVSKHLKVLERAGLIERTREAQSRPCRLTAARLEAANAWTEAYRRFWERSFDQLGEYLMQLDLKQVDTDKKTKEKNHGHPNDKKRARRRG